MRFQVELGFLLGRDFETSFILFGIQIGSTSQTRFRPRGADIFEHRLVTHQRLASPVLFDMAKQFVFNRIPFGGTGRQMGDGNRQTEFVGYLLESPFPQPAPIAIV